MVRRKPGEVVAIIEAVDPVTDVWILAAVVYTEGGPVAGRLVAPASGGTGQLGFEPDHDLTAELNNHETFVKLRQEISGLTSSGERPADPDDPRGIRAGTRRPGMTS